MAIRQHNSGGGGGGGTGVEGGTFLLEGGNPSAPTLCMKPCMVAILPVFSLELCNRVVRTYYSTMWTNYITMTSLSKYHHVHDL